MRRHRLVLILPDISRKAAGNALTIAIENHAVDEAVLRRARRIVAAAGL